MIRVLSALFFLFFPCIFLFAQITFENHYGGVGEDHGLSVQQTKDSGYIVAGVTESTSVDDMDFYLIKTDANGTKLWSKKYGGKKWEWAGAVQQTFDGGYIVAGVTKKSESNVNFFLVKTDTNGDTLWTKTWGESTWNWASNLQLTKDSSFVIVGQIEVLKKDSSTKEVDYDVCLIKMDTSGKIIWKQTYPHEGEELGNFVKQTNDNGFIIIGETKSYNSENHDIYFIKTDDKGTLLWQKNFGGKKYDSGYGVVQTTDNGYIFVGATESYGAGNSDVFLIKTDVDGNHLWDKTYGGEEWDWAGAVLQTADKGYIITGTTESFGAGESDVYLIKTDKKGNLVWSKTFGGKEFDASYSIQQTNDGGFIIAGATKSLAKNNIDVYLIKVDSEGNISLSKKN